MANDTQRKIHDLLSGAGFRVLRAGSHLVWSNGEHRIITAATASDHRAYLNIRAELRRKLRPLEESECLQRK